jgi:hypothetical protein
MNSCSIPKVMLRAVLVGSGLDVVAANLLCGTSAIFEVQSRCECMLCWEYALR